jgi:hypothetical protein
MAMPLADGEFERLHGQPPPRDAAACGELARRIEPAGGFVIYGILWFFVGGAGLAFVPALLFLFVAQATMPADARAKSVLLLVVFALLWLAGEVVTWWLFARFVRGRRRRAAELFSDGIFVDATPGPPQHHTLRSGQYTNYRLSFTVAGKPAATTLQLPGHQAPLPGNVSLLYKRDNRRCCMFPDGSRGGCHINRWVFSAT